MSRACDACRSAKDKCDGARPRCQRCITLRRQCTYLNPGKRRGIRTGYLRAIELALALLMESLPACEGVLLRALAERGADLSGALLDKDASSPAAEALLGRWQQSEAFKAVGRLISRDEDSLRDDETVDGDGAGTSWSGDAPGRLEPTVEQQQQQQRIWRGGPLLQGPTPPTPMDPPAASLLELPRHFRYYLDTYFTSSHSSFPIADEEAMLRLADSYPPTGVRLLPSDPTCALHSELWGAMAVGAALASQQRPQEADEASYTSLYATARKLLPLEEGAPTASHVRSLLLLSLVKLTSNETNAAWSLIGQAVTLLLQLIKNHGGHEKVAQERFPVVLMACFVLDTLVSLTLGNPSHMRSLNLPTFLNAPGLQAGNLMAGRGAPTSMGRCSDTDAFSSPKVAPLTSLYQHYKFAKVLSQHLSPSAAAPSPAFRSGPSDIIESLEPPFHFCNSLVQGSAEEEAPSAVLAQAGFLTGSILLSSAPAPRLLQNLLDKVRQYAPGAGSRPPPPLLALYVELATGDDRMSCLSPDEREKTAALLAALKGGMRNICSDSIRRSTVAGNPRLPPPPQPQPMRGLTSEQPLPMSDPRGRTFSHTHSADPTATTGPYGAFGMPNTIRPLPNNSGVPPLNPVLNTGFEDNNSGMVPPPAMPEGYSMDYDAILDELSSMDYVDSSEPDPQFMANLGFAPGSELNDMFGGHFGLV